MSSATIAKLVSQVAKPKPGQKKLRVVAPIEYAKGTELIRTMRDKYTFVMDHFNAPHPITFFDNAAAMGFELSEISRLIAAPVERMYPTTMRYEDYRWNGSYYEYQYVYPVLDGL